MIIITNVMHMIKTLIICKITQRQARFALKELYTVKIEYSQKYLYAVQIHTFTSIKRYIILKYSISNYYYCDEHFVIDENMFVHLQEISVISL